MEAFQGVGVALITPFDEKGNLDEKALKKVLKHILQGVDYLVLLGTTSEAPTLTLEEKKQILTIAAELNTEKKPVVVGIGGNNTKKVCEELEYFQKHFSFDGVLSVCPYYNKPNQKGLEAHFATIAQNSDKPIILYNVPGRTSSNLLPETVLNLAHRFKNIVAIKEASGNIEQGIRILLDKPDHFEVLSGDDGLSLAQIAVGYKGVISVIANAFPVTFTRCIRFALENQWEEARKIFMELYPFIPLLFQEGNPTGVKALLHLLLKTPMYLRLPLVRASEALQQQLRQQLETISYSN